MEIILNNTNILKDFHWMVIGKSNSGKTTLLYTLILHISKCLKNSTLKNPSDGLFIIDAKRASLYSLKYSFPDSTGKSNFASTPEEAIGLLENSVNELDRRAKLLDDENLNLEADYKTLNLPANYVVIDELVALMSLAKVQKLDKKIDNLVLSLVTRGRQLGVYVIFSLIRPDVSFMPSGGILRSTMNKILLSDKGMPDSEASRMLFNTSDLPKPSLGMTYFMYMQLEADRPTLSLTPRLSPNFDIRGAMKQLMSPN